MESVLTALRSDPLGELESYFRQLVVHGDPDASRWVLEDLRLTHEDAVAKSVEGAMDYPPLPALARYPGPKLSVISDMNSLPYSLHRLVPDLPVRLMPGTGHWLMMDRPGVFNSLLDEFLAAV
jgi:pimeloyl-ACP methyl ester carboxylesterase